MNAGKPEVPDEEFETMLTGGHPNSLGRTVEVVAIILANQRRLPDLLHCYGSQDEVVRLRTSSALKRVCKAHPDWIMPHFRFLIDEIGNLDQASAQWSLADIFLVLKPLMNDDQRSQALSVMKRNLQEHHDWIVINRTINTLAEWSRTDEALKNWIGPELEKHMADPRKSVAGTARKAAKALGLS